MAVGCCDCFGFNRKRSKGRSSAAVNTFIAKKLLREQNHEHGKPSQPVSSGLIDSKGDKITGRIKDLRGAGRVDAEDDLSTSMVSVKETHVVVRSEDLNGNKTVNEYVREGKLATGSYGKVVLHRSRLDNKMYAIKIFHKSRLRKVRVAPNETAMMDVLREVEIMKKLNHPNIVKLVEVMDDPENDHFYMVLEYVEGRCLFEGAGPPGGIGEATAQSYFRDIVAGLMYLHERNVVHRDIKPENLLISGDGHVKICDFGVSRTFEDDNDELRRSPGTPVYTAPECCLGAFSTDSMASNMAPGLTYHGKAADVWALGCTLYCMVLGRFPFMGDTLHSTYDKIVHDPLYLPDGLDPDLASLLSGLLDKDPQKRLTLSAVCRNPWLLKGYGVGGPESSEGAM